MLELSWIKHLGEKTPQSQNLKKEERKEWECRVRDGVSRQAGEPRRALWSTGRKRRRRTSTEAKVNERSKMKGNEK
jgi:hypothetical protein